MKVNRIDYSRLGLWSHTDLAYIKHDSALHPFIAYPPGKEAIPDVIAKRKSYPSHRSLLYKVLKKQYSKLGLKLPVTEEVLLDEQTFTVTTSHQPTLLTGPLYHIYKIASTIHLSKDLTAALPGCSVLPVFVVGGEDHDWAEVNHLYLFGKRYEWQRAASGSCGRLSLEGLDDLITTISALFSHDPYGKEIKGMLETCFQKATNNGEFHQLLIYHLFGHQGLIILNMDDDELKRAFVPLMEREIREQFSLLHVTSTQAALEKAGFKAQAFCRPVNLFYMGDQLRERLDPVEGGLMHMDSGQKQSIEEVITELNAYPARFSPNVILRPLYQEFILPNLAFLGGGGEIAYWLERKTQFEAAGVAFPMLLRRNSLLLVDSTTQGQMEKAGLQWDELLDNYDTIVKSFLQRHSQADLNYEEELKLISEAFERLAQKADKIDPTLAKAILAEATRHSKQFEQLGSRLLRAEKHVQETSLKRIQKVKDRLFPEGGLQERLENFLPYYALEGQNWIDTIIKICDPLEEKFTVVEL